MATCEPLDMCDTCSGKHKSSVAVKWCPECEEKLCEGCLKHHHGSKLSRHHTVIEIKYYKNIPDSIAEIENFCNQHGMKFSHLCPQHDKLCCPACTTGSGSHSECKTLLLQDVIKTASTSSLLKSMESSLKSLQKNIKAIIGDRQTNIQQLHDQRKHIDRKIKEIKEMILKHLDAMEKKIMEDVNSRIKQNTKQLESEIADLEKRLRKSENLLMSTTALVDFGSDLQAYIGSKTMEAKVVQETNALQDLANSGSLKQLSVKLEANDEIKGEIDELFGTILEDEGPLSIALTTELAKQAQISMPSAVSINDIKLSLRSTIQISGCITVYGCFVFASDKIILANYRRSCVTILKANGDTENEIQISPTPYVYDVTAIANNTIAVSCGENIKIINIRTGETEKTIPTGECYGVEYYNGSLIYGVSGKGVVSVDLKNNRMATLVQDTSHYGYLYCTVHKNNIYLSCYKYSTITCYSMRGEKLWEYEDTSVIYGPWGIAVDNNSNVYVASYSNNRVVVLSPNGKSSRTLLTEEDGISYPTALHFNRSKNQLTVVNYYGPAFLFNI